MLKEKLKNKQLVVGAWSTLGSPLAAEAIARSGLDFILIDFEHGPFAPQEVHRFVGACAGTGCEALVRLPEMHAWIAQQALDQGAGGLLVSHVENGRDARRLIEISKYPPLGNRGFSPFTKAAGFRVPDAGRYTAQSNQAGITGAIVESPEALERLDEILATPEIDLVYFGAYDLSAAMGKPAQIYDPGVVKAITAAVRKTESAGKCPGGFVADSTEDLKRIADLGIRFIPYSVDSNVLCREYGKAAEWAKRRG